MPLPWFRIYSEILDDPKVQMMPEHMRWRWIALLCSRSKEEQVSDSLLEFRWRVGSVEVQETKSLFMAQGFIDASWSVLHWDKRQWVSDNAYERVKRHRAKQSDTPLKRFSNARVTSPDTDSDTEAEKGRYEKRYF